MGDKIVAVDIDEVISDSLRTILERHNYFFHGKKIKWEDITNYNIWNISKLGLTKNQSIRLFLKYQLGSGIFNRFRAIKGAKEKILELKCKGYKFYAVTARFSLVKLDTRLRIQKNFNGCFEDIKYANFFTRFEQKKSDICKELGSDIIIEDNLETCIDCANEGIKCYLLDKPWNQNFDPQKYPSIIKVNSWEDIEL